MQLARHTEAIERKEGAAIGIAPRAQQNDEG